jgi:hypothetical protein
MKSDTQNIAVTLLLIASSLGIGRTGFAWHERLEEQALHISELEDQIVQIQDSNAALARDLDVVRQRATASTKEDKEDREERVASNDVPVVPPADVPQTPEIDVAFLQSTMAQIQALQNQQNTITAPEPKPTTPTKTTTTTPVKRSRTTRAS